MKQKELYKNKAVIQQVYDELVQLSDWYNDSVSFDKNWSPCYDRRDIRPLSYLVIDLKSVPEDQKETHYKNEVKKLCDAFETRDPKTGRPYPEKIKPYLKRLYTETAGVINYDIDWNDKEAVEKSVRSMLLLQTVAVMYKHFPKEYYELFPDAQERKKIDAGIARNQALFNRANELFKKDYELNFQRVNELSLYSQDEDNLTRFIEYFGYLPFDCALKGSDEVVIDPGVDPILTDYFSGREINAEQFDPVTESMEPYDTEFAEANIWSAMEGMLKNAVVEYITTSAFKKTIADHILINGVSVRELIAKMNLRSDVGVRKSVEMIRNALTDGKSRVEIARFSHDMDGNVTMSYQQMKLDLSKLSPKSKFPTNAQRDKAQNSPEGLKLQERRHVKFEHKYMSDMLLVQNENPKVADGIPVFKWNDEAHERLEAYEKKVDALVAQSQSAEKTNAELAYMLVADENAVDYRNQVTPNVMEYLENNKLDPASIVGNIKLTVSDLAAKSDVSVPQIHSIIRSAQLAAFAFMTIHPTPDVAFDKVGYDALAEIFNHPEKAFAGIMTADLKKEIGKAQSMKAYTKTLMNEGKAKLAAARAEARAAEQDYTERLNAITNDSRRNSASVSEGIEKLRNDEIKRLKEAYADGKLPKDYFEQRTFNLERGLHDAIVPFGSADRPSFKQFKTENAEEFEGMSADEVKFLYNRMMENAQREEKKFILTAMGLQPKPVLEPAEIAQIAATDEKVKIQIPEANKNPEIQKSPEVKPDEPQAVRQLI